VDAVRWALTRAHPQLSRQAFAMPIDTLELNRRDRCRRTADRQRRAFSLRPQTSSLTRIAIVAATLTPTSYFSPGASPLMQIL
jgi:hypothetical protein